MIYQDLESITVLRTKHGMVASCGGMSTSDCLLLRDEYNLLALMRGEPLSELIETFHRREWIER